MSYREWSYNKEIVYNKYLKGIIVQYFYRIASIEPTLI